MLTNLLDNLGPHQLTQVLLFAIACVTFTTNIAILKLAPKKIRR